MTSDKTSCDGACGKACKCISQQGSLGQGCPCQAIDIHPAPVPVDNTARKLQEAPRLRRIYVCHPFAADPEGNADRVRALCQVLVECGVLPVAPQIYLPQFIDEATHRDRALQLCLGLLEVCDEVRVYGGPITSGMRQEIEYAEALGIPVRFVDLEVA